jgi:tetratricopeptide (TPR) repeat protein
VNKRFVRKLFCSRFLVFTAYCLLLTAVVLPLSCKEKEAPEKKQVYVENPYSAETVFAETKRKLEAHPEDIDEWYHLGDLYERSGQYADAVDCYKKIIKLLPAQGYAYLKMGTAYQQLGKSQEAVAALKEAIRYMPRYAVAYNNLGTAYGKLGQNHEEISALKKALQLRPGYVTARFNLGMAYLRMGDKKAALQQYALLNDVSSGAAEDLKKEIDKR